MIRLGNFNVVLDACVLYDSHLRDLLLRLAEKELYQPVWSTIICDELKRNLIKKISEEKASSLVRIINSAFPEAVIDNFSKLPIVDEIGINVKDRHVLSAALLGNAQVIVTSNLKDFPNEILTKYNVVAQSPDEFLINLFYLSFNKVFDSYVEMEKSLKNPPIKREELLKRFSVRTPQFVELLKPHLSDKIIRIY